MKGSKAAFGLGALMLIGCVFLAWAGRNISASIPLFGLAAGFLIGAVYLARTAHGWRDRVIAAFLLVCAAHMTLNGMHARMSERVRDRFSADSR